MSQPATDTEVLPDPRMPWDSIVVPDEMIKVDGQPIATITPIQDAFDPSEEEAQFKPQDVELPLTPWVEHSAAPDETLTITSFRAAQRSAPTRETDSPHRSTIPGYVPSQGGGWTFPVLCAGIALIACCVLIPQADANRRLAYERQTLQRDVENIQKQIAVNAEFLKKVADDPTLAERLAERQMKVVPEGAHVLDLTHEPQKMSPFQLVNVEPPTPLPPYQPIGGTLSRICYGTHSRLYLIGISLGMIATGLVLGLRQPLGSDACCKRISNSLAADPSIKLPTTVGQSAKNTERIGISHSILVDEFRNYLL